jgi:hypothetical protein
MSQVSGNKCELQCVNFTGYLTDKCLWDSAKQAGSETLSSFKCKAFPDGIPLEIIEGKLDHTQPYEGDRGIRFKKRI